MGRQWTQLHTLFSWAPKSLWTMTPAMKLKDACSLEVSYDQPRKHIKKQRHYFGNKGLSSQSFGFSSSHVWMWESDHKEGWVLKNWCFWPVVLEKILRVPWTARRSSQSILKEISPEYSLEGLMLKLKLQYFGHLMGRTHSFEKTLMLGRIEGRRRRGWQRMRWLDGITDLMDMSLSSSRSWWWTGKPSVLQSMVSQRVRHDWATELNLGDWFWLRFPGVMTVLLVLFYI